MSTLSAFDVAQPHQGDPGELGTFKLPALEGLRAIAVAMVIGFHYWPNLMPGGFIGVDVFFVLSGFVITRSLMSEVKQHGSINYGRFAARRIVRLAPALYAMIVCVCLACWIIGVYDISHVLSDVSWVLTYASNWQRAYVDQFGDSALFSHTWSLSLEQQFYLLWPLILVSILRFSERLDPVVPVLGLAVSVVLWRCWLLSNGASAFRLYHGTETRFDELLVGAALAISAGTTIVVWRSNWWLLASALLAIGILAFGTFHWELYDPGYYVAYLPLTAACAGAVIAECSFNKRSPIATVFSSRILVFVGSISYGIYLWHLPVWTIIRELGYDNFASKVLAAMISVCLASLSFRVLEQRCIALSRSLLRDKYTRLPAPVL